MLRAWHVFSFGPQLLFCRDLCLRSRARTDHIKAWVVVALVLATSSIGTILTF
jgi:hypothetical protein